VQFRTALKAFFLFVQIPCLLYQCSCNFFSWSLLFQHSDRKLFHSLLEDQTILRVSSMMRIVLDNTDNAQHGEALKPVEAPKQRNTYLLMPVENTVHGAAGANNGNGNTHSVVNAKLNAQSHSHDEASVHSASHHSTHNSHHSQHSHTSHHGHKHHKHNHDNEDSINSNHSVHSTHSTSHNINNAIHPGGHTLATTHIPHSLYNNGLHSANASHSNSLHSVSAHNTHNSSMYNLGDKSTHHHHTTSSATAAELSHRHTNGAQLSARVSSPPHLHGQRSAMRETHINHG